MIDTEIIRPRTLKDAVAAAGKFGAAGRYLAGGTDLVLLAKRGVGTPAVLIDISRIPDLRVIEERKDHIFIGACATFAEIGESDVVREWAPAVYAMCPEFAAPTLRSTATIGGNCANASPAGDSIPALYASEASLVLAGAGQTRDVPAEKFFLGVRKTVMHAGEIIMGVKIPKWPGHRGVFLKMGPRRGMAISKLSLAMCAEVVGKSFGRVRIAVGAVAQTVIRATAAEKILENQPVTGERLARASEAVCSAVSPITDHRSTSDYRRAMCGLLLRRAAERILA